MSQENEIEAGDSSKQRTSSHKPQDPEAVETVQTGGDQAVVHERLVLQKRNHDRYTQEWGEWEDVEGRKLREKYGQTPEEWKRACKMWLEVGGRYEFRIFRRVDTEEWSVCFSSEATDTPKIHPRVGRVGRRGRAQTAKTEATCAALAARIQFRLAWHIDGDKAHSGRYTCDTLGIGHEYHQTAKGKVEKWFYREEPKNAPCYTTLSELLAADDELRERAELQLWE